MYYKSLTVILAVGVLAFGLSNVRAEPVRVVLTKSQVATVCGDHPTGCTKSCGTNGQYNCSYGCGSKGCSGTCDNCPGASSPRLIRHTIRSGLTPTGAHTAVGSASGAKKFSKPSGLLAPQGGLFTNSNSTAVTGTHTLKGGAAHSAAPTISGPLMKR
jgi:hypothetical protein